MAQIIETLKKLIVHEESARKGGSIAEAEAFAAKIQTLLTAHKLSMSEVEIAQQEEDEPIAMEDFYASELGSRFRNGKKRIQWMELLANAVAENFFCRSAFRPGTNVQLFIGRSSDRAAAIAMYRHLATQGVALSAHSYSVAKDCRLSFQPELPSAPKWKQSFLLGYAIAIYKRLENSRKQLEKKAETDGNTPGLVHIRKLEAQLDSYVRESTTPGRTTRKPSYDQSAARLGFERGSAVSLASTAALPS